MDPWARMAASSAAMGLGCRLLWGATGWDRHPLFGLPAVIAAGVVIYVVACRLFHVQELASALRWLRRVPLIQAFVSE